MEKILFTDIDGVLNNNSSKTSYFYGNRYNEGFSLDWKNISELVRIVKNTNCTLMISSNWRKHTDTNRCYFNRIDTFYNSPLPKLLKILKTELGYKPDFLPIYDGTKNKGDDIRRFISEKSINPKDICVIDDDVKEDFHGIKFFKTGFDYGLTSDIADSVIEYLFEEQ